MEFIDRFAKEYLPDVSSSISKRFEKARHSSLSKDSYENSLRNAKSSTTIIAFKYDNDDGVLMSADRRVSMGYDIVSDEFNKIFPVTPFSAVAFCGVVHVAEEIKEDMTIVLEEHISRYGIISTDGQVKFLSNLLRSNYYFMELYGLWGMITIPIFAAYDPGFEKSRLFAYEPSGYFYESDDFIGDGCGWPPVRGIMSKDWDRKNNRDQAIRFAVTSMYHSGILSHGVSESRIIPPTMITMDKNGTKEVESELLESLIKKEDAKNQRKRRGKES